MPFKDRIRQIQHFVQAIELTVLIWGPGEGVPEHFAKRVKIRHKVTGYFHKADVQFSEDLGSVVPGANDISLYEQELWHLAACDMCIVLDTSKGAGEEIAHFTRSDFAHKLLILTHMKYKGVSSFPAFLRINQNQLFYNDQEYEDCSLVERILTRLEQVALSKMAGFHA